MFDTLTGDTVAAEVQMTRAGSSKPIIILEGDCDTYFYKNLLIETNVEFVIAHGKENAINSITILNKEGKLTEYLAIVDSDFDKILGIVSPQNVFSSDYHDFEMGIVFSKANEKICKEYVSEKVLQHVSKIIDLSMHLCTKLLPLSLLRLLNEKKYNILCFEGMDFSKFSDKSTLVIDLSKLVKHIIGRTIAERKEKDLDISSVPIEKAITEEIDSMLKKTYSLQLLTNGHDYISFFSYALQKAISTVDPRVAKSENMSKIFRLTFSKDDFIETQLYKDLLAWQNPGKPIIY